MDELKIGDRVRFMDAIKRKIYPQYYPAAGTVGVVVELGNDEDGSDSGVHVKWPAGSTSDDGIWFAGFESLELLDGGNAI